MKKGIIILMAFAFITVTAGLVLAADKNQVYHVCNCKDDCKCNSISKDPGKCTCGQDLTAMHLLAIDKDTAVLCRCGADCSCAMSKTDPEKCGCGKSVKKIGLKGKYICGCGGDCKCNSISDKPGKCGCGKDMKQVL
jgi:hypothetical protein